MGKESRMRNDVKLGLAVGGLLLGVVLAYALFFSNTSKKDLPNGSYTALNNGGDAATQRQPAPATADPPPVDSNPSGNTTVTPPIADRQNNGTDTAPAN